MEKHDSFPFRGVIRRYCFLSRSEPVDLIWVHAPEPSLPKAVLMAGVQEPDPELNLLAIFIVYRQDIVESIGYTWDRWLSHAVLKAAVQLGKLLSAKLPFAVMIARSESP